MIIPHDTFLPVLLLNIFHYIVPGSQKVNKLAFIYSLPCFGGYPEHSRAVGRRHVQASIGVQGDKALENQGMDGE